MLGRLVILLSIILTCNAMASSFGEIAQNVYEPVTMVLKLLRAVSIICGVGLVLGSVMKYMEYRRNPIAVSLGMVVFTFLFGVALIILGLIPMSEF